MSAVVRTVPMGSTVQMPICKGRACLSLQLLYILRIMTAVLLKFRAQRHLQRQSSMILGVLPANFPIKTPVMAEHHVTEVAVLIPVLLCRRRFCAEPSILHQDVVVLVILTHVA
jgi:hypothetical protein